MRKRPSLVSLALFAPLLLLLGVTVMTWRAERRYQRVADRVVHDYAAIAAWQYARHAHTALHDETMQAFQGIAAAHARVDHALPISQPEALLAARGPDASAFLNAATAAFSWDATTDSIVVAGDAVSPDLVALARRRIAAGLTLERPNGEPHRMLFDSVTGRLVAIALWVLPKPDGVRGAYAVIASSAILSHAFTSMLTRHDLLPATTGVRNIDAGDVALRVTRRDGSVVFKTAAAPGSTAATDSSTLAEGELSVTFDLSPRLAQAVLAGTPSSQLPALALVLAIAAALATLGLWQLRAARALDTLRTRFVANVSHELRTPLAQISMFAETLTLGRERSESERRHFAGIILAEARRLTALVGSVLHHSRGAPGSERLERTPSPLSDEVAAAIEAYAPIAMASGVGLRYLGGPDLVASVDRAALRQVLLNLLDNAVKHGGRDGEVTVAVRARSGAADIVIDDRGAGIPPADRERVFEPFVQLERGAAGAGIGLSVVRDLVRAHGGTVGIESAPGGGARAIVSLPAEPAPHPAPVGVGA